MRIIAKGALREHWQKPGREDSKAPLESWYALVRRLDWSKPADVKAQFRNASVVGERVVFNFGGNKYRLVAYIRYRSRTMYIRFIGTHAEYDKIDVRTV
jgi:mRNA interferase HigB